VWNGTKLRRIWDDSGLGRPLLRFAHPFGAAIRQAVSASLRLRAGVVTIYIPGRCPELVWGAPLVLGGLS